MDLPQRKRIRLKGYDYSQNGLYFITICVKDKHELLGEVVGDGVLDVPKVKLSDYGNTVEKYICLINNKSSNVEIEKYCIMPNHIHMIIMVACEGDGTSRTPSPTNAVIPMLVSTLKRFINREIGFNMWQRSYHDHVIRNDKGYQKIWQYIDTNPSQWENDCFYSKCNNTSKPPC